jgi:hypothetical protein
MFQPLTIHLAVPLLLPNPYAFCRLYAGWAGFWLSMVCPPKPHANVVSLPRTFTPPPARPVVDMDHLPEGVVRFR